MILIRNGIVVDPASGREGEFDLLIEKELVRDVQPRGVIPATAAAQVIDAGGRWVAPGLIDMHVHLREPGFEWKETVAHGARAAVAGGYTAVCCMPNTRPANDCAEVTRYILDKARLAGAARVLPIGAVSVERKSEKLAPLSELRRAGCVAFSDDGDPVSNAGLMRRALEWCLMLDTRISCHEEERSLCCDGVMNESPLAARLGLRGWPTVAEDVMTARDIELARYTRGKVHICHVASARGVELLRRAKNDGIDVTAEVTPHHLLLTEEAVADYDTLYKMMPPLRGAEEAAALWEGLCDGTIDAIASDHAPHEQDSKLVEFDSATVGVLGLQTSLPLLLECVAAGKLSRSRAIEVLAAGPARVLGLELGSLAPGRPADVCIIDPDCRWTFAREAIKSKSFNSPFLGRAMIGAAETVLVAGRVLMEGRELRVEA